MARFLRGFPHDALLADRGGGVGDGRGCVRAVPATLRVWRLRPRWVGAWRVRLQRGILARAAEHLQPAEPAAEPLFEPAPRREPRGELLLRRAAGHGGRIRSGRPRGAVHGPRREPATVLPATGERTGPGATA